MVHRPACVGEMNRLAPMVLGVFLGSVQLISLGIIGEYVGSIHNIVQNRPLVTEKERINF